MSGMYYTNPYSNPYMQYGVDMPVRQEGGSGALSSIAPYAGPLIGAGLNLFSQWMQNRRQEDFYARYMSPQARMAQMKAAGINPNSAAQGISGAPAPQMSAAAPTGAFTGIGEQLGQSANNELTAGLVRSEIEKNIAEKGLTDSLNVEKTKTNAYLDSIQQATLDKLVQDGKVSRYTADILSVDAEYAPGKAAVSFGILLNQLRQSAVEVERMTAEITREYAQAYQAMANGALSEAQIHKVFSDIGLNNAMIDRISHEVGEIDARTAATWQGITESEARTSLIDVQRQYEQRYLDIFKQGYDMKSSTNTNFFANLQRGDIDNCNRIMVGIENYLQAEGDGRAHGKDYKFSIINDYLKTYASFVGMAGLSSSLSQKAFDKGVKSGYDSGFDYARSIYGD